MIDAERVPTTTYRIERMDNGYYNVQVFSSKAGVFSGDNRSFVGLYRPDAVPEWMKDIVRLLDFAGTDVALPVPRSVKPIENLYWIYSDQLAEMLGKENAE
jgi:Fe-S oxidoreductase